MVWCIEHTALPGDLTHYSQGTVLLPGFSHSWNEAVNAHLPHGKLSRCSLLIFLITFFFFFYEFSAEPLLETKLRRGTVTLDLTC